MKNWLDQGFAAADGKSRDHFDLSPSVNVVVGDGIEKCRAQLKPGLALYTRGMGARGHCHRARAHALKHNTRLDGSTSHVMDFDPDTGEFIKQDTHQGLNPTPCWARGRARV